MQIHHIGLQVKNLDEAIQFYTDILGLKLIETLGMRGQLYYSVSDGNMTLEIEQAYEPYNKGINCGFDHFALVVEDLVGFCDWLEQNGVSFLLKPSQFRPDRKIAFVTDPEGNRIQLIQFV